jgi:Capsular polysaccharide synthesis protein
MNLTVIGLLLLIIVLLTCLVYIHSYRLPKVAWIYWDSLDLPKTIQQIKENTYRQLPGWTVHFLNKDTLRQYITAFPRNYDTLKSQAQSDWIRLYLLNTYGGLWLDAGIIINKGRTIDAIYNRSLTTASEMTVFENSKERFTHSSGLSLPLVIDSWFIMAPKGSSVVGKWLREFEEAIEIGFLNYKRKAIRNGVNLSGIYFTDETDAYLTVHICIEKILQKDLPILPPIILIDSNKSMFKIQNKCNWNEKCIVDTIHGDPSAKQLPFIKLTGSNRAAGLDLTQYFQK